MYDVPHLVRLVELLAASPIDFIPNKTAAYIATKYGSIIFRTMDGQVGV